MAALTFRQLCPSSRFCQTEICNKQGGSAVLKLDKYPTKTGQFMVLSTTGWHIVWARVRHAWGSAGHGHCNCSAGATIVPTQDSLELQLPPLAFKGKPVNKFKEAN